MTDSVYMVEYSHNSSDKCEKCQQKISNGELRIVCVNNADSDQGEDKANYHTKCFSLPKGMKPGDDPGVQIYDFVDNVLQDESGKILPAKRDEIVEAIGSNTDGNGGKGGSAGKKNGGGKNEEGENEDEGDEEDQGGKKGKQGFASMDKDKVTEIARKGGKSRGKGNKDGGDDEGDDEDEGNEEDHGDDEGGKGKQGFASMDKDRVREIARKGGKSRGEGNQGRGEDDDEDQDKEDDKVGDEGRKGKQGFASMDKDKVREIARKGGKSRGKGNQGIGDDEDDNDEEDKGEDKGEGRKGKQGFASMDKEKVRVIAKEGGKSSGKGNNVGQDDQGDNDEGDGEDDKEDQGKKGKQGFASMDKERVREIARKGGKSTGKGKAEEGDEDVIPFIDDDEREKGKQGFASMDKDRVREIGKKGGEARKKQLGHEGYVELGRQGGKSQKNDEMDDEYKPNEGDEANEYDENLEGDEKGEVVIDEDEENEGNEDNHEGEEGKGGDEGKKGKQGFASMDKDKVREIARKGGKSSGKGSKGRKNDEGDNDEAEGGEKNDKSDEGKKTSNNPRGINGYTKNRGKGRNGGKNDEAEEDEEDDGKDNNKMKGRDRQEGKDEEAFNIEEEGGDEGGSSVKDVLARLKESFEQGGGGNEPPRKRARKDEDEDMAEDKKETDHMDLDDNEDEDMKKLVEAYGVYFKDKVEDMKDVLRWNRQIITGNRPILLMRAIDCHARGRLARCALCGGRLKLLEDGCTVQCVGAFDKDSQRRIICSFKTSAKEAPRWHPWYTKEPSVSENAEMDYLDAVAVLGPVSDMAWGTVGDDLMDTLREELTKIDWNVSSKEGLQSTAQEVIRVMRESGLDCVPENKRQAQESVESILAANYDKNAEDMVAVLVQAYGYTMDPEKKAAQKKAAVETMVKNPKNAKLVEAFRELSDLYLIDGNRKASNLYEGLVSALEEVDYEITEENAMGLNRGKTKLGAVSRSLAEEIRKFYKSGTVDKLEKLRSSVV